MLSVNNTLLHFSFSLHKVVRLGHSGKLSIHMWFLRDGMKICARHYATIAPGKSLLRGKKGPPLSLEHVGTLLYTKVWAFAVF
jgi:hypothetical protein